MKLKMPKALILDFDIENRPLNYGAGDDFTFSEITAISAAFSNGYRIYTWLLGVDDPAVMLLGFKTLYNKADIVTGHYIRKHDLPIINGALVEAGIPALAPKLTIDTYLDLKGISGVSKSQENLATMLGVEVPKIGMSHADWREANRLTQKGLEKTARRVTGDVRQHQALRLKLAEMGYLESPKIWSPDI